MPAPERVPPLSSMASQPADVAGIAGALSSLEGRFSRLALPSSDTVGLGGAGVRSGVACGSGVGGGVITSGVGVGGGGAGVVSATGGGRAGVVSVFVFVMVEEVTVDVDVAFSATAVISFSRDFTLSGNGNSYP